METNKQAKKNENLLISIVFNIVIPVLILSKFTTEDRLGPIWGVVVALLFPISFFFYDYFKQKKTNFISIIGFVSILLTGVIGIFEFPSEWLAYKEAAVPLLIGIAVLISLKTPFPLVKKLLYQEEILDVEEINGILKEKNKEPELENVLKNTTYMLAASFLLSAILNFVLAKILIKSPTGTEAFAQELADMTMYSYVVIALPSTCVMMIALWYLFKQLKKLTGLETEKLFAKHLQEQMKEQ